MLFDNFNGQCTDGICKLLEEHHINVILIPANCTDQLQPLALTKLPKHFYAQNFRCGLLKKLLYKRMVKSPNEPVDLCLSKIKPLEAQWLLELYDHFKANPSVIVNGFKAAGITDCLSAQ